MRTTRRGLVVVLMAFALLAAACGGGRSDSTDDGGGSTDTTQPRRAPTASATSRPPVARPRAPTRAPAGEQGVTADSVTIGYGDDAGYQAAPGLNKEMSEAVEAMIDWCNEQGGINGRTVKGNYYDAAILNANNAMAEACTQVFMLVGAGLGPRRRRRGDPGQLQAPPGPRLHRERHGGPRPDDLRRGAEPGRPHADR